MASIKGINRSAVAEFSPDSPYLATGTMAGAVDLSFSSSASLEIFKLDFQSDEWELPLVGEYPCNERFNRLSWGTVGSDSDEFSLGLIAAGLVDGSLHFWNPKKIIANDIDGALVERTQKHTGPVRGLEFNVNAPNLLASGADEGEIYIWDLVNPATPTCFPPLKGVGAGAQGEISSISWNHKVQHILASTSYNGTTVVWDLKRQKPVISFSDTNRRRCSVLQWNPDVATQLIVASDDDVSPSLRVWDVRNTMSPLKEFVGHSRGVLAMSWCPSDSSFLLTCAKDNRTICWDTTTGEGVCELPAGTNWNFDIHWYPKLPGIISASSFDGKIGIYNIEACSRLTSGEGDFAGSLTGSSVHLRAPKWMKRPVGATFAFGGKLVTFCPGPSAAGAPGNSEVYVHNLVTELDLVGRSSEFEAAIQSGEKTSLRTFCDKKCQDSQSEDDRETWSFLKVMFEDEGTARTKLLSQLGFSVHTEENGDLNQEITSLSLDETTSSKTEVGASLQVGGREDTLFPADNGEDFFNNLETPKADASLSFSGDSFTIEGDSLHNGEQMQQESEGLSEMSDSSLDEAIQRALVVGDYKGAVLQCVSANRMADALVIAHASGPSLWEKTRDQYLKNSRSSYLKVVSAMVCNDLTSLVNSRPLKSWKETLALLCTFAQREEWTVLCDTLASRLMMSGNTLAATLCYICAGNIDKTVEMWSHTLKSRHEGKSHVDLLQDLMEKTIVLALATGQKRFSASLSKLVENYVELLAGQGLLSTAMEYLKLLGSEEPSHELAILRDRIAFSTEGYFLNPRFHYQEGFEFSDNIRSGVTKVIERLAPNVTFAIEATREIAQFRGKIGRFGDLTVQTAVGIMNPEKEAPKPMHFDSTQPQPQPQPVYGADQSGFGTFNNSQSYYQESQPQQQQSVPGSPYGEGYQQPFAPSYGGGYQPVQPQQHFQDYINPATFQPTPSPHMFLPTQAPQIPQTPAPVTAQPVMHTFIPATPPALKNAGQYQQPTLGTHLYPGGANPVYQGGPPGVVPHGAVPSQMAQAPGHRLPSQVVAPPPAHRNFMSVTTPGFVPRPGASPVQPSSPTQPAQVQPAAAPPAPPPTMQTVDTSKVPDDLKPVIATLTRLYNETSEALGGARANPSKKREIEDNSKKIGSLFAKLNSGDISPNASSKLVQLCRALDTGDFASALHLQVVLTTSDWDECNFWLAALKRMIKTRQNVRLN